MIYPDLVRLLESTFTSEIYPTRSPCRYLLLIFDVTTCSPTATSFSLLASCSNFKSPSCTVCRSPLTIHLSKVVRIMALTFLSSIIELTVAQFGPTSVTIPTSPVPDRTFISFLIPSLLPLSIVNFENQLLFSLAITFAATFG